MGSICAADLDVDVVDQRMGQLLDPGDLLVVVGRLVMDWNWVWLRLRYRRLLPAKPQRPNILSGRCVQRGSPDWSASADRLNGRRCGVRLEVPRGSVHDVDVPSVVRLVDVKVLAPVQ